MNVTQFVQEGSHGEDGISVEDERGQNYVEYSPHGVAIGDNRFGR